MSVSKCLLCLSVIVFKFFKKEVLRLHLYLEVTGLQESITILPCLCSVQHTVSIVKVHLCTKQAEILFRSGDGFQTIGLDPFYKVFEFSKVFIFTVFSQHLLILSRYCSFQGKHPPGSSSK